MILDFSKAYIVKNLQYLTTGLKNEGVFSECSLSQCYSSKIIP